MNTEFPRDRNSFSQADTVSGVTRLINRGMIRESISKMKNGKAEEMSVVVTEIAKTAEEAGIGMITRSYSSRMELSTIVNCYKRKGDSLERRNYRGLKLTDQILKTTERITEK